MIDGSVAAAAETLSNSFDFWAEGGIGARRKRGIGEEEGQAGGGRQIPEHHGHKGQEEELLRRRDKIGHEEWKEGRSGGGQKGA